MQVSDFHYDLPDELIAQEPAAERDGARMLVVSRQTNSFHDDVFRHFPNYLCPRDCLILNDTRVIPARLHGHRNSKTGAVIEIFLVRRLNEAGDTWQALARPGKRARSGDSILFSSNLSAEILTEEERGKRIVRFHSNKPILPLLEQLGETPLPPYIHRSPTPTDRERYQTVFAKHSGSAAAPTAGLHFTPQMLEECRAAGAEIAHVTLHVGLGTFAPLRAGDISTINLHEESFRLEEAQCAVMRRAARLLCVGTTSVRAIETVLAQGELKAQQGETNLFIHPGFAFRGTGAMLTNFHLPQSSLLMLVAAFAGHELTFAAYQHAVQNRYRFFSYGDCMLIV